MMSGNLEVCYHKSDGKQHSKELIRINIDNPEKSAHFEFKYNNRIFILDMYIDIFGLAEVESGGKERTIFCWDEETAKEEAN